MDALRKIIKQYWGYESFLPLQREAMECALERRDSLVVLPTGGGKSLCFQAPALRAEGMALVVSPLIALMKDQVDALAECGVAAACLNGSISPEKRRATYAAARAGRLKLLYMAPERLLLDGFLEFVKGLRLSFIAVDEAHCISMWGHDFRPEYRQLRTIKQALPGLPIHAYTATATEPVRRDIAEQLGLRDPAVLVGSFDRPNLFYRVEQRRGGEGRLRQVREAIDRHRRQSGVIYCISRKRVEELSQDLNEAGYKTLPYHAGLSDDDRRANQEAFIRERVDIIVATVAFGMGIDKSNVRYVIHAEMPKSIEHYQQESGRAGRDGLKAECCLFYSMMDYRTWKRMLAKSDGQIAPKAFTADMEKLAAVLEYCEGWGCRRDFLLRYFGQSRPAESCGGCDRCGGDRGPDRPSILRSLPAEPTPRPLETPHPVKAPQKDTPLIIGQKILSCVVRLGEASSSAYVAMVLTGSKDKRIAANGHRQLSTFKILGKHDRRTVRNWIGQLLRQGYLTADEEDHSLKVTDRGWSLLRGEKAPRLREPSLRPPAQAAPLQETESDLFEVLRRLRRQIADEKNVPPYVVFSDATLRDMVRRRPATLDGFGEVTGVGRIKLAAYGEIFVKTIAAHLAQPDSGSD